MGKRKPPPKPKEAPPPPDPRQMALPGVDGKPLCWWRDANWGTKAR